MYSHRQNAWFAVRTSLSFNIFDILNRGVAGSLYVAPILDLLNTFKFLYMFLVCITPDSDTIE